MLETIIIGNLIGINPFDQQAVEQVKILTKKIIYLNVANIILDLP